MRLEWISVSLIRVCWFSHWFECVQYAHSESVNASVMHVIPLHVWLALRDFLYVWVNAAEWMHKRATENDTLYEMYTDRFTAPFW